MRKRWNQINECEPLMHAVFPCDAGGFSVVDFVVVMSVPVERLSTERGGVAHL